MRYDGAIDRYVAVTCDEAFSGIGAALKPIAPEDAVFYASGPCRAGGVLSLCPAGACVRHQQPAAKLDMCHETTSVGLTKVIGSPVGTIVWVDLEQADAFFSFGQNPGTNSPRFLHPLKEAKDRGAKIVTFNPIIEQGLVSFVDPQSPAEMLTGKATTISEYH